MPLVPPADDDFDADDLHDSTENATEGHQDIAEQDGFLAVLDAIEQRQRNRPFTDGSDTLRYLAEGRDGDMFGFLTL